MPRTEVWGKNPPKCGAKKRASDGFCSRTAGAGTDHIGVGKCNLHGGTSPSHIKAAARQVVMNRMEAAYGDLLETDPASALLTEVKRASGVVEWISAVVRDFTAMDLDDVDQKVARRAALEQNAFNGWQAAAWVDLYYRERKHLAMVSKMALDAGVAERRVKIEEAKLELVAGAVKGIFNELNLTPEQRAAFPEVARRHLEALRNHDEDAA
jgi:hypothetical protein